MYCSHSLPPAKAVDDILLSNVSTSLTKAREQLSNSAKLLQALVWEPTHDKRVDTLVRQTVCMALAYRDDILPKSKKLIANLQCFLEMYTVLEFKEFLEILPDVIKMAEEYAEQADGVSSLHKSDDLLQCINGFWDLMATLAGFFTLLHHELAVYGDKLRRLSDNPILVHYKLVNKKAQEIIAGCTKFVLISSQVEIDLRAIELTPGIKPAKGMSRPPAQVILEEIIDGENEKKLERCIYNRWSVTPALNDMSQYDQVYSTSSSTSSSWSTCSLQTPRRYHIV